MNINNNSAQIVGYKPHNNLQLPKNARPQLCILRTIDAIATDGSTIATLRIYEKGKTIQVILWTIDSAGFGQSKINSAKSALKDALNSAGFTMDDGRISDCTAWDSVLLRANFQTIVDYLAALRGKTFLTMVEGHA